MFSAPSGRSDCSENQDPTNKFFGLQKYFLNGFQNLLCMDFKILLCLDFKSSFLGWCNMNGNDIVNLSPLGPERKGDTPVHDPGSVHDTVMKHHLSELSAPLDVQKWRVGNKMADTIRRVTDKATFTELETLMSAARESINKTTCLLRTKPTAYVDPVEFTTPKRTLDTSERALPTRLFLYTVDGLSHPTHTSRKPTITSLKTDSKKKQPAKAFLVRTIRTENMSKTWCQSYKGDSTLTGVNTIISGCRDTPVTTMLVHRSGMVPTEHITQQSEDHNWSWCNQDKYCTKDAVSVTNWPHSRAGRKRTTVVPRPTLSLCSKKHSLAWKSLGRGLFYVVNVLHYFKLV